MDIPGTKTAAALYDIAKIGDTRESIVGWETTQVLRVPEVSSQRLDDEKKNKDGRQDDE
jgi:hypothetical protein